MIPQASEVDKERLEVALKRVTKDSQRRAPGVFEKMFGDEVGGWSWGKKWRNDINMQQILEILWSWGKKEGEYGCFRK